MHIIPREDCNTLLEHNKLASDKVLLPTNHSARAMRSSYTAAQCSPIYSQATIGVSFPERAEGGLCALRAAPSPMSERERELYRRMTSLTKRHRAWQRSWSRTERVVPRGPFAGAVGSSQHARRARRRRRPAPTRSGDHPRIRGEHYRREYVPARRQGIIPAYAGSTNEVGESMALYVGSSPHTRGAHPTSPILPVVPWDHPRIRGEHPSMLVKISTTFRIIPAYAGSTTESYNQQLFRMGSSPHTRGAQTQSCSARTG